MSISKRAQGVDGFKSTPRAFPSSTTLEGWAPELSNGKFVRLDLSSRNPVFVYQFPNGRTINIELNYTQIDQAADQAKYVADTIRAEFPGRKNG